eukprot:TRINITY_DN18340_c1_g1_i1.p1 TRINITY_DN18340_c1_g1~~TRINITY_DN18340_c1_g1_i1.p1  ORF type:complete len:691 (-),score=241.00 TRINITY_DN18340_c1_g1_i1:71-2143(-)
MARVLDILVFNGDWSDSLGNDVRVWDAGRGTQVVLSKPDGRGKEIQLGIKQVGPSSFQCGHYDLDEHESNTAKIVWRDKRQRDRFTVWTRKAAAPPNAVHAPAAPVLAAPLGATAQALLAPQAASAPLPPGQPFGATAQALLAPGGAPPPPGAWGAPPPPPPPPPPPGQQAQAWPGQQAPPPPGMWGHGGMMQPGGQHMQLQQHHMQLQQQQMHQQQMHQQQMHQQQMHQQQMHQHHMQLQQQHPGMMGQPPHHMMHQHHAPMSLPINTHQPIVSQGTGAPWQKPHAPQGDASDDWQHVLSVLAAARDEPAEASAAGGGKGAGLPPGLTSDRKADGDARSDGSNTEPDEEAGAAGWSEVLDLLASAGGGQEAPPGVHGYGHGMPGAAAPAGAAPGQIDTLFSGFGLAQQAAPQQEATEELRAQVLQQTLARLLSQKTGGGSVAGTAMGVQPAQGQFPGVPPPPAPPGQLAEDAIPDWQKGLTNEERAKLAAPRQEARKRLENEGPLDAFIRVFKLDELAEKCLRALADDEVAFVIESCQGRLKHAKNPSAVVMTSIKTVAARVGRRYYGSKYNSELARLLEAHAAGKPLTAGKEPEGITGIEDIAAPPEAEAAEEIGDDEGGVAEDPYGAVVDLEDLDDDPPGKRAADGDVSAAKKPRVEPLGVVELAGGSPADDDEGEDDDNLFFVDTG